MNDFAADDTAAALAMAHDDSEAYGPVVPAIVQTSLFTFSSYAEMERNYTDPKPRPTYSRVGNPTVRAFEEKMIALEAGEDAVGFASGMAAISASVLAFVKPGDRVVAVEHVYPDAYRFFETFLKKMEITVVYVDGRDLDAVEKALEGARLFYMESPTSWTMQAHDVAALARLARAAGAVSVIDNSWATPIFQKPLTLGCDVVVHSASKYIGGHSDTVAGVAVGSAEKVGAIRSGICPYLGGKLAPFDAWLLLRGLRTLAVRMRAVESAALSVARRLSERPEVAAVLHPGLANALPDGLTGTSGLFSVEFDETVAIPAFIDALKLFKLGVSWGGHESLAMPAKLARTQANGPNSVIDFGVSERVVRLNIGLEGPDALWRDLLQAIERSKTGGK
ncbi:MAG: PLP-dependent transferase [Pararhizobium sp.]